MDAPRQLFGVGGCDTDDVWAVGYKDYARPTWPFTLHWDGSSWATVFNGTESRIDAVWSTCTDTWFVGEWGAILRYRP